MRRVEARIANRLEDLRQVVAMVDRFGAANRIAAGILHDLNVVLDEALNNVITHGFPAGAKGEIVVRLALEDRAVVIEIVDGGRAFDPRQAPAPDLTLPLRERRPGGVGIHFMKTLMDDVAYHRLDGQNVLRMTKALSET
jgi:anti-sigma regulatory factor (Ser/Thr protein kinase)